VNVAAAPASASAPLRVLHVYSGNLYGGVETVLVTLARLRGLSSMVPEYALCFEGRLSEELRAEGVPVHALGEVRVRQPWTVALARWRLKRLLGRGRYDVVVCHSPWAQALLGPVVARAGTPLVFFLHDAVAGRHWLERWAARTRPVSAVCNSRFTASKLGALYPGLPHDVVYLPLPAREAQPGARERLRAAEGVPEGQCVILQVSRMQSLKGQRLHLRALGRLRHRADWRCWMVGGAQRPEEADYLASLQRLAAELGIAERVHFLGQRRDIPDLLAAADVFCQPNELPDAFGLSFIEALRAGRPVVTTRMGGALEVVDEGCGVLVPPEDVGALASALERLVAEPAERERLGRNGPERAHRLCAPEDRMVELATRLRDRARGGPA
jgi:glycosyltransferase involved in cell wall biosynthesis